MKAFIVMKHVEVMVSRISTLVISSTKVLPLSHPAGIFEVLQALHRDTKGLPIKHAKSCRFKF